MRIEQNFLESDLIELEKVFSKSMEYKNPMLKKGKRFIKIWNSLLILATILFECNIALRILKGKFSLEMMLYIVVGVIIFFIVFFGDMLEKKMNPENVVKQKYGEPFVVILNESTLVYKQTDFLYTEIKFIIEYKNFLFIKTNKRWLIIKANREEKNTILSKVKENITIQPIKKEEPFDLREFR